MTTAMFAIGFAIGFLAAFVLLYLMASKEDDR